MAFYRLLQGFRALFLLVFLASAAEAHDPIFGIGPHVLYKAGTEFHLSISREKLANHGAEAELEVSYGITSDWSAGAGVSYPEAASFHSSIFTKYRFWRQDTFGTQESAAIMAKVISGSREKTSPSEGSEESDYILGLAYGYEGRKWYRWASIRHRINAKAVDGNDRPDVWLVDFAGGIRFVPSEYHEPDWVWMLELNGELVEKASQNAVNMLQHQSANQWFLSPGLMWTYRNLAIKSGAQLLVYNNVKTDSGAVEYRAHLALEFHF